MDRDREQNEKLAFQRQKQVEDAGVIGGIRAAGFGEPSNQTYSPRLSLMSQIDRMVDDLMSQVTRLHEFRRVVERGSDREASLIEEAIKALQPR